MNKRTKQKPHMSFWGIGPLFVLCCIITSGLSVFFSIKYPHLFIFKSGIILPEIFGSILIVFGLYLWIGVGRKIRQYIKNKSLATKGGYGIVRNPVYSGILFVLTGISLFSHSFLLLASVVLNYFILVFLIKKEERILLSAYGEKFKKYKKEVKAVIPGLKSFFSAFFYPEGTGEITDNLFAVKSRSVTFFIYKTRNQYLCFDTGYGDKQTMDELKSLGISADEITKIFLTHTDHDHIKGIPFFKNAKVFIGANEKPLIEGRKKRFRILSHKPNINDYTLLEDKTQITVDDTLIETIYTTGHTIGHIAYLINGSILITGDAIIYQNGLIKPFYRFFNMDQKKARETNKLLEHYQKKCIICTAHTGVVYP